MDNIGNPPNSYPFLLFNTHAQVPSTSPSRVAPQLHQTLHIGSFELQWRASAGQLLLHGSQLPPAAECDQFCNSIWRILLRILCCGSSWELIRLEKLVLKGGEWSTQLRGQICSLISPPPFSSVKAQRKCILHDLFMEKIVFCFQK